MATTILHEDNTHIIDNNLEIFSLIWLDANINRIKDSRNSERKLRNIINHLKKFEDKHMCQQYIEHRPKEDRLVLIVSGQLGQELVPRIHHLKQICSIYVYCTDKRKSEGWTGGFSKVRLSESTLVVDKIFVDQGCYY